MKILEMLMSEQVSGDTDGSTLIRRVVVEEGFDGAQLIVNSNQIAMVYVDGCHRGSYGPGRHHVSVGNPATTQNLLLSYFDMKKFPKTDVFFINQELFSSIPWSVEKLVVNNDDILFQFDISGTFSGIVAPGKNPASMVNNEGYCNLENLMTYVQGDVIQSVTQQVSTELYHRGYRTINHSLEKLSDGTESLLKPRFHRKGFKLTDFVVSMVNITGELEVPSRMTDYNHFLRFIKQISAEFHLPYEEAFRIGLGVKGTAVPPSISTTSPTSEFDYLNIF